MKKLALLERKCGEKARIERMVQEIESAANYSLALLGWGFILHGSGRYVNIRPVQKSSHGRCR